MKLNKGNKFQIKVGRKPKKNYNKIKNSVCTVFFWSYQFSPPSKINCRH